MKSRSDLIEKVKKIEAQMLLKLEEIRHTFDHKGVKGSFVEKQFRDFLKTYLPRRLGVGTGEIIDRHFNTSNQIDVVITTEEHPFTYADSDPGLFFVEGTCASGEIKSILTTEALSESLEKATHYKKLTMTLQDGAKTVSNPSDLSRWSKTPPYFIFAFESQISVESIYTTLKKYNSDKYSPGYTADAVFVLNKGFAVDIGDNQGFYRLSANVPNVMTGWNAFLSDTVLFDFLTWLTLVMPRITFERNILIPYLLNRSSQ